MTDVAKLKTDLEQKLQQLTRRAAGIGDTLRQPADDDWSEQASDTAADDAREEIGDSTIEEIDQIKQTLAQIEAGKYGVCTGCKRAIAAERLAALPYATTCIKCA